MSPAAASHVEANWTPSRRLSLAQARRRSFRIRVYRACFVALAAISAGVLIGALARNALDAGSSVPQRIETGEQVTMLNPRFTGRDRLGRSFVLTAATAVRQRGNPNQIALTEPRMVDEQNRTLTAPRGLYDQDAQTLELFESVRAEEAEGYVFLSTHATLYVSDSRVVGNQPLRGSGPIGDVEADTYEILEDGASVRLTGNVKTTLYPDGRPEEGGTE